MVVEATVKRFRAFEVDAAKTVKSEDGVEVPMPSQPAFVIVVVPVCPKAAALPKKRLAKSLPRKQRNRRVEINHLIGGNRGNYRFAGGRRSACLSPRV